MKNNNGTKAIPEKYVVKFSNAFIIFDILIDAVYTYPFSNFNLSHTEALPTIQSN